MPQPGLTYRSLDHISDCQEGVRDWRLKRSIPIIVLTILACACTNRGFERAATDRAKQIWDANMAIVDRSVQFWKKKQPGPAPYGSKELTRAIMFFETLTEIKGANLSYLGPIPDEQLEKVSGEWKAWYALNGNRLVYDESKNSVVVIERSH